MKLSRLREGILDLRQRRKFSGNFCPWVEKKDLAADEKREMSTGKRRGKGAARLMALLLLCSLGSGALVGARASESTPAAVTEAQLFSRELREKGALRFYDATEEELRLGRFEAAFLRYRFLKARVGGDPAYRPLTAMVDHRLRFLAGQMGLAGQEVPPLRATRARLSPAAPRAVKDSTPAKGAGPGKAPAAPAAAPESAASPPPASPPRPSPETSPASGPPAPDAAPPAAPEQQKPSAPELTDQKPGPEPPAPSPSRWQRLKARLFFWRK